MAEITFTLSDNFIERVKDATEGNHPIPLDLNGVPLFTKAQWAKEFWRRKIKEDVINWENKLSINAIVPAAVDDADIT